MTSLSFSVEPVAQAVNTSDDDLVVTLADGRVISAPLVWFPRLHNATPEKRSHYQLMGNGVGIHWPDLDEDISVIGLLAGQPSIEYYTK